MTTKSDEKTQILLNRRLKFKLLKGKRIRSGNHARSKVFGHGKPCETQTNNKQRGQLCTLVVEKEKIKKKHKQSITDGNPIIICLHVPHHMKKGATANPIRRRMTKIGH
jgi:hypothetical protein